MTNAPTTDFTCCLDEDCRARTSEGWLTCASRRLNEDLLLEHAADAWFAHLDRGFLAALEVFNDPSDIAYYMHLGTTAR